MKKPDELASQQVLLSSPSYSWERVDFWVNEGPAIIKHDGMIYLTYSASATGSCYCMGMLSASENSDLLDPEQWHKKRYPILRSDEQAGMYGPGHNSFTVDEMGRDVMIYHCRQYDEIIGDPLYDPNRHTYRMYVEWKNNEPKFLYSNNF